MDSRPVARKRGHGKLWALHASTVESNNAREKMGLWGLAPRKIFLKHTL